MTTCDYCEILLHTEDLFNVEYLDEDSNPTGWMNVLCEPCVEVAIEERGERFVEAWK